MNTKKIGFLTALLLCLCLLSGAMAETTFEGTVVEGTSVSVTAPFGGIIDSFNLRVGSVIREGDPIATVETTKVYAPSDGTVTGVFAAPGDDLADVITRMGAVLYLTPENKYTVTADIQYAYNAMENKYVSVGEKVYLSCTTDGGKHTAEGVITAVSGTTFTVETTSGELMLDETVRVYRNAKLTAKSRIGGGDVTRSADVAVDGSGSLLYLHVKEGDAVTRGQLLYETVSGALDGLYASSNQIVSNVNGIIAAINVQAGASISKGDALLTVYPQNSLLLQISISEYDLNNVSEGDPVTFTMNYRETESTVYRGTVDMISYVGEDVNGEVTYTGYVTFESDDQIRLGMTAAVSTVE